MNNKISMLCGSTHSLYTHLGECNRLSQLTVPEWDAVIKNSKVGVGAEVKDRVYIHNISSEEKVYPSINMN